MNYISFWLLNLVDGGFDDCSLTVGVLKRWLSDDDAMMDINDGGGQEK